MLPELSPLSFVTGLLLVYTALVVIFVFVLKSRSALPLTRRRPGAAPQTSAFARLTDRTVHALTKGARGNFKAFLDRE